MENTSTPGVPLEDALDKALEAKRERDQAKFDADMRLRSEQVRTLENIVMRCNTMVCPHCGGPLLKHGPLPEEEDYNSRI